MNNNLDIYLVGGAVRDELLERLVKERDWVVVGATPEDMLAQGFTVVGKDFPVFLHPDTKEEYALARTERKSGHGYTGFSFNAAPDVSLEEDLLRRDLTVNAIAKTQEGEIIDPYHGVDDLKAKILRHVSPAFVEDPVRVLRVARFAARYYSYGFTIAEKTMQLMKEMVVQGEIDYLVPERVWQETAKALAEDSPRIYFEVLRECGALKVIFPEIDNLYGIPNPEKHHPEIDTGVHTMMVVDAAVSLSPDPKVRFAALVHDLGKALTPKDQWPKHIGHEEKGVKVIEKLCERIRVPKDYKELAILGSRFHLISHKVFELKASTIVRKLERLDCYRRPQRFEAFLIVCTADYQGRLGFEDRDYPQAIFWRKAYAITQSIDTQPLIEKGLKGNEIANEIHSLRVAAVQQLLTSATE